MPKIRSIMLSLLTVTAVSATTPAPAPANSTHIFLIEGTPLTSGSEALEGTTGVTIQLVETLVAKSLVVKECQEDTGTGTLKPNGESEGQVEGKNCFMFTKTKRGAKEFLTACTVTEPVKVRFKSNLIEPAVGEVTNLESTVIISGGSCSIAGEYTVSGKQICAGRESQIEKIIHEATCTPAGSAITLKKEPAQLFGTGTAKLKSGKKWAST